MLYAAIDIHKHAFQAAVLDPETGGVVEARFPADRECLGRWAEEWRGRGVAVAIEATTGWRWVWRELVSYGFEVRLAEPVQARALLGGRGRAKTDRLHARWLARLLAKEMLPAHARLQIDSLLAIIGALEAQLETVDAELRRGARVGE